MKNVNIFYPCTKYWGGGGVKKLLHCPDFITGGSGTVDLANTISEFPENLGGHGGMETGRGDLL